MELEELTGQAALRSLQNLEDRMQNVSRESNQFATRFLFGGIVAVIALLNTDLLIDNTLTGAQSNWIVLTILLLVVLLISWLYFNGIAKRMLRSDKGYRRTKHKYEVLLYGIFLQSDAKLILEHLEREPKPMKKELDFPSKIAFSAVAEYLHDHHGRALSELMAQTNERNLAMLIVILAIIVKALMYMLFIKI